MTVYINGVSDEIKKTLLTTVGDTIYASAASTPSRLGVGGTDDIYQVAGGLSVWRTLQQQFLSLYSKYIIVQMPTNAGWTETLVGAGSNTVQRPLEIVCDVTNTANASALLYALASTFNVTNTSAGLLVNWDKWMMLIFQLRRNNLNANHVGRFQLKETTAIGALAAKGIGARVDNDALVGESYGSTLGTVSLGVSLADGDRGREIIIVHDPSVPEIKWYTAINGVATLGGTQSTATNIPSGIASANSQFVLSILNGDPGAGGTLYLGRPIVIQEV